MGKHLHALAEIDREARSAVCKTCGPTHIKLRPRTLKSGERVVVCAKRWGSYPSVLRNAKERRMRNKDKARESAVRSRRPWRQHVGNVCERCGFVPEHVSQLDVDHIDGNRQNGDPSNLQTLCANCHRLKTHLSRDNYPLAHR